MFGKDGAASDLNLKTRVMEFGLRQKIFWQDFFRAAPANLLLIVPELTLDSSKFKLLLLEQQADAWQVKKEFAGHWTGFSTDLTSVWQDLASQVELKILQNELGGINCVLILPSEKLTSYYLQLPVGITETELSEAAYWELEARLTNEGYLMQDFLITGGQLDDKNNYWLGTAEKLFCDEVRQAFQASDLTVEIGALLPKNTLSLTEGASLAMADLGYLSDEIMPSKGVDTYKTWNYGKIASVIIGMVIIIECIITGVDSWQLYKVRTEANKIEQELTVLKPERQALDDAAKTHFEVQAREAKLLELAKNQLSGYSVLVHLATLTMDGVWLDKLTLEAGGEVVISGHATDFATLASYLKLFEADSSFFAKTPVLMSSEQANKPGKGISFEINLAL